jgi:hypothetical protein
MFSFPSQAKIVNLFPLIFKIEILKNPPPKSNINIIFSLLDL